MLRRFEQFSFCVSGIYHAIQQIEREEMERFGLKGPYAQYLVVLARFPEGIPAARLCEICDRDKAAVSRAVGEMESRGLLRRERDGTRSYRAGLVLTHSGQKAADYVCRRVRTAVELAGAGISDRERAVMYGALERIASNLQAIGRTGLPGAEDGDMHQKEKEV